MRDDKLSRRRAKLLNCLITPGHFEFIYVLPPSKVHFITLCSGGALYLRHPIWNIGGRTPQLGNSSRRSAELKMLSGCTLLEFTRISMTNIHFDARIDNTSLEWEAKTRLTLRRHKLRRLRYRSLQPLFHPSSNPATLKRLQLGQARIQCAGSMH